MNLDRVTMTGADHSIRPEDLLSLSQEFPFVEWGILVSNSSTGRSRFPYYEWIIKLQEVASVHPLQLSLHICGRWTRDLLIGYASLPPFMLNYFQRVQLNFHADRTKCEPDKFAKALSEISDGRQFIFQLDGALGNEHMEQVSDSADCAGMNLDCVGLFDVSGGAGIVPREWPKPQYLYCVPGEHGEGVEVFEYHGYAGGLGPDTLEQELPRIAEAAGDCRIWIDMETRVRSDDDRVFDLEKVRRCLEICQPHVTQQATA